MQRNQKAKLKKKETVNSLYFSDNIALFKRSEDLEELL